jgi:hypothetical protein
VLPAIDRFWSKRRALGSAYFRRRDGNGFLSLADSFFPANLSGGALGLLGRGGSASAG